MSIRREARYFLNQYSDISRFHIHIKAICMLERKNWRILRLRAIFGYCYWQSSWMNECQPIQKWASLWFPFRGKYCQPQTLLILHVHGRESAFGSIFRNKGLTQFKLQSVCMNTYFGGIICKSASEFTCIMTWELSHNLLDMNVAATGNI